MNALNFVFAGLAALGVYLVIDGLRPRRLRLRLTAPDERPASQRIMAAFFAPVSARLLTIGRVDLTHHKIDLALRLAQANYPQNFTTPEAVLAYQLLMANND